MNTGFQLSSGLFWTRLDSSNEDETKKIPFLKYYTIFNLDQTEGIPENKIPSVKLSEFVPTEEAERIVEDMKNRPEITFFSGNRACYSPSKDTVTMPYREQFPISEEYYSTIFHELSHSTGHPSRLARKSLETWQPFGSEDYTKKELIAEMSASFLCAHCNLTASTIENSTSYIASWLKVLKEDYRAVITAAGAAQKAADYILGTTEEKGE